jgi:protein-S-isoprenylcysteine O-methyltransferase Ste14
VALIWAGADRAAGSDELNPGSTCGLMSGLTRRSYRRRVRFLLGLLIQLTVLGWLVAEVVMQVRQYRQGGAATRNEWRSLGVIVASIVVGQVLATVALHVAPLWIPLGRVPMLLIALPVTWLGIGFRLWSIHSLGRFFRGVVHVQADHHVVRTGPYRVLRHPSYAGALVAVLGLSLTFQNWTSIVLLVACALAGIYYRIRVEEQVLRAELGQAYIDYSAETSRLIPRVW